MTPRPQVTVVERSPWWRHAAMHLGLGEWHLDDRGRVRRGGWQQSYTGERYWPLDPLPDEIHYDDFCVGLARAYRYRGQTREEYSVAEHSVIVSLFAQRLALERGWTDEDALEAARYGLVHDLPEAYLGDVARPLKRQRCMRGYRRAEARWERAALERLGLRPSPAVREIVREVDDRIFADEVEALCIDPDMYARGGIKMEPLGAEIAAMNWRHAAVAFSQRWADLWPDWE